MMNTEITTSAFDHSDVKGDIDIYSFNTYIDSIPARVISRLKGPGIDSIMMSTRVEKTDNTNVYLHEGGISSDGSTMLEPFKMDYSTDGPIRILSSLRLDRPWRQDGTYTYSVDLIDVTGTVYEHDEHTIEINIDNPNAGPNPYNIQNPAEWPIPVIGDEPMPEEIKVASVEVTHKDNGIIYIAADVTGSPSKVEFNLTGTPTDKPSEGYSRTQVVTGTPYLYHGGAWDSTQAPDGHYKMQVKAYRTDSRLSDSKTVEFDVNNIIEPVIPTIIIGDDFPASYTIGSDANLTFSIDGELGKFDDVLLLAWHIDLKQMVSEYAHSVRTFMDDYKWPIANDKLNQIPPGRVQLQWLYRIGRETGEVDIVSKVVKEIKIIPEVTDEPELIPISIEIIPQTASINYGESAEFTSIVYDQNGNPLDSTVTWSSTANLVAGDDSDSVIVSAVSPGDYVLYASIGDISTSITFTVLEQVEENPTEEVNITEEQEANPTEEVNVTEWPVDPEDNITDKDGGDPIDHEDNITEENDDPTSSEDNITDEDGDPTDPEVNITDEDDVDQQIPLAVIIIGDTPFIVNETTEVSAQVIDTNGSTIHSAIVDWDSITDEVDVTIVDNGDNTASITPHVVGTIQISATFGDLTQVADIVVEDVVEDINEDPTDKIRLSDILDHIIAIPTENEDKLYHSWNEIRNLIDELDIDNNDDYIDRELVSELMYGINSMLASINEMVINRDRITQLLTHLTDDE